MKRIIVIGECRMAVECGKGFDAEAAARPAGLMTQVALKLASLGHEVLMLSEVANDDVGRALNGYLQSHGVDTSCFDCYTEGLTPVAVSMPGCAPTLYTSYPAADGFDVIWPRLDEDNDIVIFGGYMTLSQRWRHNYVNFMSHVVSKGCRTIYMPGDISWREPRATKIMPQVFENLERAGVVVLDRESCRYYFGTDDPRRALVDTVEYYCPSIIFNTPGPVIEKFGADVDPELETLARQLLG